MLSLFTPQATCTANRFGAALTSTPGSRSHDKVIEDGRKVLSLTGPPREPIGPGGPAGPVSPCKEQGWSQGVCLGPLRQPPLGALLYKPHQEDSLPCLQVGRQDQEDRWDLRCPKQLEN